MSESISSLKMLIIEYHAKLEGVVVLPLMGILPHATLIQGGIQDFGNWKGDREGGGGVPVLLKGGEGGHYVLFYGKILI